MKSTLALLTIYLGICASVASFAATNDVSVGVYHLPPHMIVESSDSPQGAVPRFLQKYVFNDSPYSAQWHPANFSRILVDLERGRIDMAILVAKNPERAKKFIFSERPLYETRSGIVVKRDSKIKRIQTISDLHGLTLGHDLGSIVPSYFEKSGVNFQFISGENYFDRTLSLLRSGRIDGFFVPTWSHGSFELKKNNLLSEFSILEIPSTSLNLYIAFNAKTDKKIIAAVDKALRKHRTEYLKILGQVN